MTLAMRRLAGFSYTLLTAEMISDADMFDAWFTDAGRQFPSLLHSYRVYTLLH